MVMATGYGYGYGYGYTAQVPETKWWRKIFK